MTQKDNEKLRPSIETSLHIFRRDPELGAAGWRTNKEMQTIQDVMRDVKKPKDPFVDSEKTTTPCINH